MLLYGAPLAMAIAVAHRIAQHRDRLTCRAIGHDPCWVLAISLGIYDRPVCKTCRRPLP